MRKIPRRKKQKKQREYIKKYTQKSPKAFTFKLNVETDKDIINKLESEQDKIGYIRNLIRKDLA